MRRIRPFSGVTWEGVAAGSVRAHDYNKKNSGESFIFVITTVSLFTDIYRVKKKNSKGVLSIVMFSELARRVGFIELLSLTSNKVGIVFQQCLTYISRSFFTMVRLENLKFLVFPLFFFYFSSEIPSLRGRR